MERSGPLELICLGTGTSSALPSVGCLTDPQGGCHCCRSTLTGDPEAKKNIRRNSSAVLRIPGREKGERTKSLLIDCGKTFYTGALEFWPKHGLREIDAVLLTHAHADAILGLDDLRGWTLRRLIQSTVHIYCNQFTFDEIAKAFPYLTDVSKATGGGDVPAFTWHIFDENKPLTILGVAITPLKVHHGQFFSQPPTPYYCTAFLFDGKIAYFSDVSYIPEEIWDQIGKICELPPAFDWANATTTSSTANEVTKLKLPLTNGGGEGHKKKPKLQVCIMDCLRIIPYTSHYGLGQAIATARRLGATKTYLVGFSHRTSHANWEFTLQSFERLTTSPGPSSEFPHPETPPPVPEHAWQYQGGAPDPTKEDFEVFKCSALRGIRAWEGGNRGGFWVRPACDGMTIRLSEESDVPADDVYNKDRSL